MFGTVSILFYPKKRKSDTDGLVPLYARITVNGQRGEFSLGKKIDTKRWCSTGGKLRGTTKKVSEFNIFLDYVRNRCYRIHEELLKSGEPISAQAITDTYLGKRKKKWMLLEIFRNHNDEMASLVGTEFSSGTLQRYKTAFKHTKDFVTHKYNRKDIPVEKVNHEFITGLEYFLKSKRKLGHNSAVKYIINLKKIIRIAYANQWISRDPFFHWKASWKTRERKYLTEDELRQLIDIEFHNERLKRIRDIFIFCCFTGLSYVDVKNLTEEAIAIDVEGQKWIKTHRRKTKTLSSIPLLPIAEDILKRYQQHPFVVRGEGILPVSTNQKSNAYLKEIAEACGIKKNLTTHLARHTFATTVTLSNGVPIESVSKMLGHTSLKTTQI
ncbi:MAG TPA: site-specific integrase [Pricia antarctica]|uniref:Site-specific integrase n=2 Tax=root TaxID=1 RepID=A0A831QTL4_9FLAO|nr:site-specific integrase [Pricia antarctica]